MKGHVRVMCPPPTNAYSPCMAKISCFVKGLVSDIICSMKEDRMSSMKSKTLTSSVTPLPRIYARHDSSNLKPINFDFPGSYKYCREQRGEEPPWINVPFFL
ncbi:hypothetical protein TNCV_4607251 [Trichonephila clavipes]|nr:hypothetical protein TNCV_4607251 [Trichonephila clavipes]